MPTYRVRFTDDTERLIQAQRRRRIGPDVLFENTTGRDRWTVIERVPADRITVVHRRQTELDGSWLWMTERDDPRWWR